MLLTPDISSADWAERCDYWLDQAAAARPKRRLRQRQPAPLILNGHGVSLRVEGGALVIRDGFTHYPQPQAKHRFFPGDHELPSRILLLDGSGTLSFDVLSWLAAQGVALARIRANGEIATVASGTGYAADRDKVRWQQETRDDPTRRLAFATDIIGRKISACTALLETHFGPSRSREIATEKGRVGVVRLETEAFPDINSVFTLEGECASAYFAAWVGLPITWTGLDRRPVPDTWQTFTGRSSLANGTKAEKRNATHPINAMLNYAYTVKLGLMQIQAIAEGYDPTLGIMHNGRRGSPAMILDLIEPHRAAVDASIIGFVRERSFSASDFILRSDGVCRLSPQLSRVIAAMVSATGTDAQKANARSTKIK